MPSKIVDVSVRRVLPDALPVETVAKFRQHGGPVFNPMRLVEGGPGDRLARPARHRPVVIVSVAVQGGGAVQGIPDGIHRVGLGGVVDVAPNPVPGQNIAHLVILEGFFLPAVDPYQRTQIDYPEAESGFLLNRDPSRFQPFDNLHSPQFHLVNQPPSIICDYVRQGPPRIIFNRFVVSSTLQKKK